MCPHCQGLGKEVRIDIDKFLDMDKSLRGGAIRHGAYKNNSYMLKELIKFGLFEGTPENLKNCSDSITARYL